MSLPWVVVLVLVVVLGLVFVLALCRAAAWGDEQQARSRSVEDELDDITFDWPKL